MQMLARTPTFGLVNSKNKRREREFAIFLYYCFFHFLKYKIQWRDTEQIYQYMNVGLTVMVDISVNTI